MSVPPPGWKEGQSGATYVPPPGPTTRIDMPLGPIAETVAPVSPLAQPGAPVTEPLSPIGEPAPPTGWIGDPAPPTGWIGDPAPSVAPRVDPIMPVAATAFEPAFAPAGASTGAPSALELAAVPTLIPLSEALVAGGQPPAEAAVRWRIRAATVDNLLVYALYLVLCVMFHWQPLTIGHVVVLLTLGVVYHFVLESMGGQTVGKRRYGIQVVSVDGGRATPKGIALRSILRFIDALPFGYLSGLISMVRTGPERRQRIGDVAGETKVIAVSGRAATRGTPRWLLPAATIFALAYSCLGVYGIAEAGHQPLTSAQEAEFVSGCQASAAGQVLDCQCMLSRLEADGYNTPASLQTLVQDAQAERLYGQSGTARTEFTALALACHR